MPVTKLQMKLLAGCEPAFVQALAARMRVVMATPEEVIFREGDVGHEMYIIRKVCCGLRSG